MAATFQWRSGCVATVCFRAELAESQSTPAPVASLCQRMSALLLPLQSPRPAILHDGSVTPVTLCCVAEFAARQITFAPVDPLCHRISALPSRSKSAAPATCHAWLVTPVTGCCVALFAD